ncbi:hypothetical protein [Flavobacterium johnsoniae]|uniref:Uncharacterized protein n=1 Tax=Flavobacterium johnsoniae (strain ATCC 17061 / DSM 2064 / JCM 8514 / BCRC 14874 / CCUG 350202 / NBRC 14942 / NCIMB 11054 / UW101) TaxID=376686 RepID=A5FGS2_FLAJ1|nr:hypothetical protein [Flavobacterium johnsoniae]ABQ05597.1 hypothetical protein Fjoh_2570 [Flavobacterium johnsoniae UW101]OXE96673.1 hypothetical protein B0A63_19405 [Flavobacterium johnsoniae UW101]WQG82600.1 hypothetical protein SR927_05665 [Flavobacterium johnsoniae UW101]SHL52800.1 hypothetical protein SAMN05444146_3898 [Flavobacterium johnsoniae]
MAVWQYLLIVVPKDSIGNNYECIFKNNKTEFLPETDVFWKNFNGNIPSIISGLDQIIPKANWGNETYLNWKGNGQNEEDNDACICLSDDKTKIEEFQFRIDLRKPSNITNILQSILNLCEKHNLVLIDLKGKIFQPKLEDVLGSIKASNATRFLNDPIHFFEDLSKNNSDETRT